MKDHSPRGIKTSRVTLATTGMGESTTLLLTFFRNSVSLYDSYKVAYAIAGSTFYQTRAGPTADRRPDIPATPLGGEYWKPIQVARGQWGDNVAPQPTHFPSLMPAPFGSSITHML